MARYPAAEPRALTVVEYAVPTGMSRRDVIQTIRGLDEVLNVFRMNEGRLTARQIRARTMLSIARSEIAQDLSDACHDLKEGTELFVEHPVENGLGSQVFPKESA